MHGGMPGMPFPSFNPYAMPYDGDLYGAQGQPMYDHAPGCGCGRCQQFHEALEAQQEDSTSTGVGTSAKRTAPRTSTKAKAKTSSNKTSKSSQSNRRKSKQRKTSSIPWING
jgi:hypothetical protein